jgi:hypothetical protein
LEDERKTQGRPSGRLADFEAENTTRAFSDTKQKSCPLEINVPLLLLFLRTQLTAISFLILSLHDVSLPVLHRRSIICYCGK